MRLAHGGQRQKNFNFYEEAIRVPPVYSNPKLYQRAHATKAPVSHVDFLTTIAGLFGTPESTPALMRQLGTRPQRTGAPA
jgi:arylsulfatase A-like enzyme